MLVLAVAAAAAPAEASPRSIIIGSLRFSFLTQSVLRIETGGAFEDAPTVTFPTRTARPVPPYKVLQQSATSLVVTTATYTLQYFGSGSGSGGGGTPSCGQLNVTLTVGGTPVVACPFDASSPVPSDPAFPGVVMDEWQDIVKQGPAGGNLGGSLDSTDCYIGGEMCYDVLQARMQMGLVSTGGWTVVDDSGTALWDYSDPEWAWRIPRCVLCACG